MFNSTHLNSIKSVFAKQMPSILDEKSRALRKAYEELEIVDEASVEMIGDNDIRIEIKLTFEPRDEEQNIPAVIEYGGVIYDTEGNLITVEPSYLIRRFFADGVS